jgi:uncharacterized membrane protein YqjE
MVKSVLLRVRIFLEGMFLWSGGVVMTLVLMNILEPDTTNRFLEDAVHVIVVLLNAVSVIWVLIARRKDLGDRISTGAYVFINLIPIFLTGWYVLAWLHSMD